jgi:transcriptional regulator with XRE-family HTH domain
VPRLISADDPGVEAYLGQVAKRVRAYRTAQALRVEDVARVAGVDRATIYRLEAGTMSPHLGVLFLVARGLGVGVHDLLPDTPRTRSGRFAQVDRTRMRGLIGQLQQELERLESTQTTGPQPGPEQARAAQVTYQDTQTQKRTR